MNEFRQAMLDSERKGRAFLPLDFFATSIVKLMGLNEVAARLKKPGSEIKRWLKRAKNSNQYVFTDQRHDLPAATLRKGEKKPKGKTLGKGALSLTDGALLDFQCVVTSKSVDRDGDELNPMGAVLDPKMPLLWQHMPFEPIGKFVKTLDQNENLVAAQLAIQDTALGRDAAVCVEFKSVRISHGFVPLDYDVRKDGNGNELNGWRVDKYHMFEVSLVSIPSNTDAIITAFNRNKFATPIMKGWGEALWRNRTVLFTESALKDMGKKLNAPVEKGNATSKSLKMFGSFLKMLKEVDDEEAKKDDEKPKDDEKDDDEKPKDDEAKKDDEKPKEDAGDSDTQPFPSLLSQVTALAGDGDVPDEVRDRANTANNLLTTLDGMIDDVSGKIATAAKNRDLSEMIAQTATLIENVCDTLGNVSQELSRAAGVEGLSEDQASKISAASQSALQLCEAVSMVSGWQASTDQDTGDSNGDLPPEDEEKDDDENDRLLDDLDPNRSASPVAKLYADVMMGAKELSGDEIELMKELVASAV